MKTRVLAMSVLALSAVAMGGCVYREKVVPAASPPSTAVVVAPAPADRVVTYPEGRYELRGEGTTSSPYFWVWVPAGVSSIPNPPPLPRVPQTN
jgi:hypothetical protein